jgi:hypothetical protein
MISRDQAIRIAEHAAQERGLRPRILEIWSFEEIPARERLEAVLYGHRLADHWIAYLEQPFLGVQSSLIVAVARDTGNVSYVGPANDEG